MTSLSKPRLEWLKERQRGLGATDIASLAGVGFSTPQKVFADKFASLEVEPPAHPLLQIGLATEDLNASLYAEKMGVELANPTGITWHPTIPWAYCTLDRMAWDRVVELKYTPFFSDEWGEELTGDIPFGYVVQTHWQMFNAGLEFADVSALSGSGEHRVYRLGYDVALVEMLGVIGMDFMKFIQSQTPPALDWRHPLSAEVQERCETIVEGKSLVLSDTAEKLAETYTECSRIVKDAEAEKDRVKLELMALMGDAEKAQAGAYKLSRCMVEGGKEISYISKPYIRFAIRNSVTKGMKS